MGRVTRHEAHTAIRYGDAGALAYRVGAAVVFGCRILKHFLALILSGIDRNSAYLDGGRGDDGDGFGPFFRWDVLFYGAEVG